MANVLTTGAWFSAPTKKPSFFVRLLRVQIEARQRQADRVVEQYIAAHGLQTLRDDAERQIGASAFESGPLAMVTLFIMQIAIKLARFAQEVHGTWHEAQRLRRSLPGPMEE